MVEPGTILKRYETSLCCPNCKEEMLYWEIMSMGDGVASHFYCDKCNILYFDTDLIANNVIEYGEDIDEYIDFSIDDRAPYTIWSHPDDEY